MNDVRRQRGFVLFAVIAAVVLLVMVMLAVWYFINVPDGGLDPGITDALQQRHASVPPQNNLFFALLAFDSTKTENINQQGQMVSDLIRTHRLSDAQYAQLSRTLVPLSDDERSLVGPVLREFEAFAAMIRDLMDPRNAAGLISSSPSTASRLGGDLSRHFIKYNPTLNAQWRLVREKIALSRGGCRNFLAGAAAFNSRNTGGLAKALYNPIGNALSGIAAPDGIQYMQALCDLDGMIRIVDLQLQAHLQHVHDDQFAQFARSGPYANPFTGKPMRIDAARRTIDFEPLATRDRVFFPWPLGAVAERD